MAQILCVVLLIWFTIYSVGIFYSESSAKRTFALPGLPNYGYVMSREMYFVTFIVVTAPLFLGFLSLAKYLIFFLCMLYLLAYKKEKLCNGPIVGSYMLFLIWLLITMFYSSQKIEGLTILLKYLLPLLALLCGYKALESRYDFYFFLKAVSLAMLFYAFWIGGFSNTFYPWLKFSPVGSGIFLTTAGLCDYFTSLFVVPLILTIVTKQKKWWLVSVIVFISQLLEVNRTGMSGCIIGLSIFLFFRYKLKAIPPILGMAFVAISIAVFVPSVNEKFFAGKEKNDYSVRDIANGELNLDNVQTNGRQYMWETAMNRFYKDHELTGSGLGETTHAMKNGQILEGLKLIHNDYVQILCDGGIVALSLFILFVVLALITVFSDILSQGNIYLKLSGILSVSSLCGTLMSMGFDNVVAHSMTSMINPFFFLGFYLKFKHLYRYGKMA